MAVRIFAAIMIGSIETEMRIYAYGSKKTMKQIDCLNTRLNLGVEAFRLGRLTPERVEELCKTLRGFKTVMEGYKAEGYRCVATSALRTIRSSDITRDYIEKQTGLKIEVISNSEQRYLDYKSISCESDSFEEIIQSGTAIVDIGANSMQISFFDKDKLVTTANMGVGKISTREQYMSAAKNNRHYEALVRELIEHEMAGYYKLYQKSKPTRNLIIVDADLTDMLLHVDAESLRLSKTSDTFCMPAENFLTLYDAAIDLSGDEISQQYQISADSAALVRQSLMFCRCLLDATGAQSLWLMDVTICDGLALDYGVKNHLVMQTHNFEEDILAAARNIAKRYKCSPVHMKQMEDLSGAVFTKLKKVHGLKTREKLLLQISAILHNCGKYISLSNVSDCAYTIIMATEIIGLSHRERLIIANVVKYNNRSFCYYSEWNEPGLSREDYLIVAKLTAMLRLANALDRSHRQKIDPERITLKGDSLVCTVDAREDVTLEKVALSMQAEFFEEVFNIHPEIVQKKKNG